MRTWIVLHNSILIRWVDLYLEQGLIIFWCYYYIISIFGNILCKKRHYISLQAKAKANDCNFIISTYLLNRIGYEMFLWKWQISTFFVSNIVLYYSSMWDLLYT